MIGDYLQEREGLMPRTKALWVSEQGEALLQNGICQLLRRLAKRASIEGMHPHRFRHSYAINALMAGMPEQVLKIVGGRRRQGGGLGTRAVNGGGCNSMAIPQAASRRPPGVSR